MSPPQHNERAREKAEVDWLGFYLVPLEDRGMLTMLRAWHEPYPSSSCYVVTTNSPACCMVCRKEMGMTKALPWGLRSQPQGT